MGAPLCPASSRRGLGSCPQPFQQVEEHAKRDPGYHGAQHQPRPGVVTTPIQADGGGGDLAAHIAEQAVKDGSITADVAQRPDLMGQYAVSYGLAFLQSGEIAPVITTPMTLALPDNVDPLIAAWEALN